MLMVIVGFDLSDVVSPFVSISALVTLQCPDSFEIIVTRRSFRAVVKIPQTRLAHDVIIIIIYQTFNSILLFGCK